MRLCGLTFETGCLSQLLRDRARGSEDLDGLDCCQMLAYTPCNLVFEGSGGRGERFPATIAGILRAMCFVEVALSLQTCNQDIQAGSGDNENLTNGGS